MEVQAAAAGPEPEVANGMLVCLEKSTSATTHDISDNLRVQANLGQRKNLQYYSEVFQRS